MIKQFENFTLTNDQKIQVVGGGKPSWAGKPDKTDWATETVIDEETGEEELEYIAPWADYEGGRKQYNLDMAAGEEMPV